MSMTWKAWTVIGALVVSYRAFGCASPSSFGCVSDANDICTCAVGGIGAPSCEALQTTGAVYGCTPDPTWPTSGNCVCVPYACTTTTGDASACACSAAASLPAMSPLVTSCPAAAAGGVCCLEVGTICACSDAASTCAGAGLAGTEVASCSASATSGVATSCPTTVSDAGSSD